MDIVAQVVTPSHAVLIASYVATQAITQTTNGKKILVNCPHHFGSGHIMLYKTGKHLKKLFLFLLFKASLQELDQQQKFRMY